MAKGPFEQISRKCEFTLRWASANGVRWNGVWRPGKDQCGHNTVWRESDMELSSLREWMVGKAQRVGLYKHCFFFEYMRSYLGILCRALAWSNTHFNRILPSIVLRITYRGERGNSKVLFAVIPGRVDMAHNGSNACCLKHLDSGYIWKETQQSILFLSYINKDLKFFLILELHPSLMNSCSQGNRRPSHSACFL